MSEHFDSSSLLTAQMQAGATSLNSRPFQQSMGRLGTLSARIPETVKGEKVYLPTDESRAYDALVKAKVFTSKIASHLPDERRRKLFASLDRLHMIDTWEDGDQPVLEQSFVSFIRAMLLLRPTVWPSLGLSFTGHLFAIWGKSTDKLNIEFFASDRMRWVLTCPNEDGQILRSAGDGPALQIAEQLAFYKPEHWFG